MKSRSIRQSLVTRIGVCMGILFLALSTWTYLTVRHGLYKELDNAITQTAALLSNQIELKDAEVIFEWEEGQGTNRALINEGLFQFWDETTGVTTRSPGLQENSLPKFSGVGIRPILKDIHLPKNNHHARAIGLRVYPYNSPEDSQRAAVKPPTDPKTRPHILVVAGDAKPIHHVLNRIRWILSIGTLVALTGLYLLISRVIQVSLRPIDQLTEQMKNRTEGELDAALKMPSALPVELNGLAENFDSLLGRVALARVREKDFIRHAAHELRTPIAGLRAVTDLALSQPRSTNEYASHLATCQKTAIELSELVSRLTALSRVGQEKPAVRLKQINLAAILNDCLSPFLAVFNEINLTLDLNLESDAIWALGDPSLVRIILNNLFDNVCSYTNPDGKVRIRAGMIEKQAVIQVANSVSVSLENIDRLFEPLFRSDSSRHDAASHLGIGLTLSREAATVMCASLIARETPEGWIEFTLTV